MPDQDGTTAAAARAFGGIHLRLCVHADDSESVHWLEPGQTCSRQRARDLLNVPVFSEARAHLDAAGGCGSPDGGACSPCGGTNCVCL
jgi:hypothetical protein